MNPSWRSSGLAFLVFSLRLSVACGGSPPAHTSASRPPPSPGAPSVAVAEPAFAPPEPGLYDVEAQILTDTCWAGRTADTLRGARFVEVTTHRGSTVIYPQVDEMPDLGFVTGPFQLPLLGKELVRATPRHEQCPSFTKRQIIRTLASQAESFTLERTADTGDASGCAAFFTAKMPNNCHHVTRYVFTMRKTPPRAVVDAPAMPAPCERPRVGKRGPFAEPSVDLQLRARIPYEEEAERCLDRIAPGMWARIERQFPGITMMPTFEEPRNIEEMSDEIRRGGDTPPDLLVVFQVRRPPGVDPHRLAAALRKEKMVEWAQVRSKAVPASR